MRYSPELMYAWKYRSLEDVQNNLPRLLMWEFFVVHSGHAFERA